MDDVYAKLTNSGATVIVMMPNLENDIMDYAGISSREQGADDMAKQFKERVQIGSDERGKPVYRWATGVTRHALQASIARIIMETQMNPESTEPSCMTVSEFIANVYIPTSVSVYDIHRRFFWLLSKARN